MHMPLRVSLERLDLLLRNRLKIAVALLLLYVFNFGFFNLGSLTTAIFRSRDEAGVGPFSHFELTVLNKRHPRNTYRSCQAPLRACSAPP